MKTWLRLLALPAMLMAPSIARADDAPPPLPAPSSEVKPAAADVDDVVSLRGGGMLRGKVTEIIPGDHVTIVVEKAEPKRIAWTEVERVVVGSAAPAPRPAAVAAPTPPLAAPMVGPRARVHINAPRNVILYRRPSGSTAWSQACISPCNQELPIGDTYRITGNGVSGSKEFHLETSPGGTVELTVDPQSTGGMVLGGILAGVGATATYVGLLAAAVGVADNADASTFRNNELDDIDGDALITAGLITAGIGAAATLGGILVFVASAKTDIEQTSSRASSDAFVRRPTWTTRTASGAPAAAFPVLLQGTF